MAGLAFIRQTLAPFEIEFHFARRRDEKPKRTIIRLGDRDKIGEIRLHSNQKNAAKILANRPQIDRDWAVAVELTRTDI